MSTNTKTSASTGTDADTPLGSYLKHRRARLDPAALGFTVGRRRTPGLRREEVAQRAEISPTWYTWLEQGRGGAPSADVLNRIADALMLTEGEREHLFLVGLGRPPEVHYKAADEVTPRLQRVLDAYEFYPAMIRTATWDVLAWNRACAVVLTDYGQLPKDGRNILRLLFGSERIQAMQADWESTARFVVGAFRADVARAGAQDEVAQLVRELCQTSSDFAALWNSKDVLAHGAGLKRINHAVLGWLELDYSSFIVEGRPDLQMVVYVPATDEHAQKVRTLVAQQG